MMDPNLPQLERRTLAQAIGFDADIVRELFEGDEGYGVETEEEPAETDALRKEKRQCNA